MKISGPNSVTVSGAGQGAGKAPAAGGFSIRAEGEAPVSMARTAGVGALSSIDTLIALQQIDEPIGRRRRAVGRAGRLLDMLDAVKLKLLDGEPQETDLQRLAEAVRERRSATDDPGLEGLLDQIETRAVVELAKMQARLHVA